MQQVNLIETLIAQPSLIKRPVLQTAARLCDWALMRRLTKTSPLKEIK